MSQSFDHFVEKKNFHNQIFRDGIDASSEIGEKEILLRLDLFTLTANNVTYGVVGDLLYWHFYPADQPELGRIPIWGYAVVVKSNVDQVKEGERLFGFFPISTYFKLKVDVVEPTLLMEISDHRKQIPFVFYHRIKRVSLKTRDEEYMGAISGLVESSFLFAESGYVPPSTNVYITSASSKTGLGLSLALKGKAKTIGITSASNVESVKAFGTYDEIITYDQLESHQPTGDSIVVDFFGDEKTSDKLRSILKDNLKKFYTFGATHWDAEKDSKPREGTEQIMAPALYPALAKKYGRQGYEDKFNQFSDQFSQKFKQYVTIELGKGREAIKEGFEKLLNGQVKPNEGLIFSP
eukprot:TRINITY_DN737_c0_g1_i1.p1 TRINITY_DN737_c0_g1~~TRINITY_DN737_c0_g1_i1.p1  ORF type:complete len:369 (-),score=99.60 TRINITY_DN737_c0_g1_i1:57-1109(-)